MCVGASLPFLTLPDPLVSGEGALDPLGLAMVGDRLADQILPGLRARMSRPRFLTAMAVSAAVCDGMEERLAADGITPDYLVFEWLVVEAFVREGDRERTLRTPGTQKAQDVRGSGERMSARTYLKAATVFGFHGIYKPLARHLGIVDDELRLSARGYELLKIWQTERGLEGFLDSAAGDGPGRSIRQTLRSAVEDGLAAGYTSRSGGWQGWSVLARHLQPADAGPNEAAYLLRVLRDPEAAPRGEVFELLREVGTGSDASEQELAQNLLMPKASRELAARLKAIVAYEQVCGALEEGFDWIRYLSTHSRDRPIGADAFANDGRGSELAAELPSKIAAAEQALSVAPLHVQQMLAQLGNAFDGVRDAQGLFEAILARHQDVQQAKPPEGKRSWFDRDATGATFVRVPYRVTERPAREHVWNRPYRISAALSFLDDLKVAHT
jgi:hypothetical protein